MSVYKHMKYQTALLEIFEQRRGLPGERWTMRQLAERSGIQPSFLTNVFKERFDFSQDQLFAVCETLAVPKAERRYLEILLDHQRSGNRTRRAELKAEIDQIRRSEMATAKHISARPHELTLDLMAEYYLDPFVQLAHVAFEIDQYRRDPALLIDALGITETHFQKILEVLTKAGYIERTGGKLKVSGGHRHLPKENPLCDPHQALIRLRSIDQMARLKNDEKYAFSVTLSGTEETRAELQREFLSFLNRAESLVKAAESSEVFQMNFDLFSWKV